MREAPGHRVASRVCIHWRVDTSLGKGATKDGGCDRGDDVHAMLEEAREYCGIHRNTVLADFGSINCKAVSAVKRGRGVRTQHSLNVAGLYNIRLTHFTKGMLYIGWR